MQKLIYSGSSLKMICSLADYIDFNFDKFLNKRLVCIVNSFFQFVGFFLSTNLCNYNNVKYCMKIIKIEYGNKLTFSITIRTKLYIKQICIDKNT